MPPAHMLGYPTYPATQQLFIVVCNRKFILYKLHLTQINHSVLSVYNKIYLHPFPLLCPLECPCRILGAYATYIQSILKLFNMLETRILKSIPTPCIQYRKVLIILPKMFLPVFAIYIIKIELAERINKSVAHVTFVILKRFVTFNKIVRLKNSQYVRQLSTQRNTGTFRHLRPAKPCMSLRQ